MPAMCSSSMAHITPSTAPTRRFCCSKSCRCLKPGVIVHVHDIMLPYEYDALFSERNYNEQYLLAGLLLGGTDWEPLLPVYWLSRAGRMAHGASFWLRRRATEAD